MPSEALPQTKLVVFDLGRVLVRICDDWKQACESAGMGPSRMEPDASAMTGLHDLVCQCDSGQINIDAFCKSASPLLKLSETEVRRMSDSFLRGPYPGAAELMQELDRKKIATACLSNTNDSHWQIMTDPNGPYPLGTLKFRFASHLVKARKPDCRIYQRLEQETRIVPNLILFFDDVAENVQAAIDRGWVAHRIDPKLNDPISQIRRVLETRDLLASW